MIAGWAAGLLMVSGTAGAELVDPTRPYSGHPDTLAPRGGSPLQSTLVSTTDRRAVIEGRTYRVGEKVGAETLVAIRPYEVVLRKPDGAERVLRMLPKLTGKTNKDKTP